MSVGPKNHQPRVEKNMSLLSLRIFSLVHLFSLLLQLGVVGAEAEREEVVGVLGSSVLLDPEITVDSSKNEILWTFKASNKSHDNILDHIPGVTTFEPSEQLKGRLQFNALSGALTISRLNASDQGDYTFTVDGKELKIMELLVVDYVKEEFGLLGSSVLLDPELKIDPNKREIVWTFFSRNILRHVPGHSLVEPSDQFKFRLHFNTSNGALTVNGSEHGDQGDYAFIVDGQELRVIQLSLFDELSEGSIFTNIERQRSTVELTCEVAGDSNVYQWQKNGGEISQRHQLINERRTLVIPRASSEDCGVYTCITTNPVSSIQTNYTLMLQGFSIMDIIMFVVSTTGQMISAASLHSTVLPDQWRWKTLGGTLGNTFYIPILCICNSLLLTTMCIMPVYWIVGKVAGLSPLEFAVIGAMITGEGLFSFFIIVLLDVSKNFKILEGSQSIRIWLKLKVVYDIVLKDCCVIFLIFIVTIVGLSNTAIVSIALSIVLPFVIILILMYWFLKKSLDKEQGERNQGNERKVRGCSIKAILIAALWFVVLMLPFTNVIRVLYVICRNPNEELVFFETGIFNLISLLGISVGTLIPVIFAGFRFKNTTDRYVESTILIFASIIVAVLILVVFISLVILWYRGFRRLRRWTSVYNVEALIAIIIGTISWMVIDGLKPEDVGVAITSMVGLVFSTAYVIIFTCWSWKGSPGDKQWWWRLNICNIVALVFILIALICWIVSKDQSCKINIPIWILFTLLGVTVVIALSRSFPVCSRNEGTNENNTDKKQDRGEVHELQTLSPGHEVEPENHPVS